MKKIEFTPFPTLTTERLILRKMTPGDLEEFYTLKSDERLLKYYRAKPKTYEEARMKLRSIEEDIASNESIQWGITLKGGEKIVGTICLWNISPERNTAEIGYELMAGMQGKGIMREAVKAVVRYGFEVMGLDLIEAILNPEHSRSLNLLEKTGFVRARDFTEKDPDGRVLRMTACALPRR